jgi:hypothetical protein
MQRAFFVHIFHVCNAHRYNFTRFGSFCQQFFRKKFVLYGEWRFFLRRGANAARGASFRAQKRPRTGAGTQPGDTGRKVIF